MRSGNQHGGRKYDDLQNWLDMTSHENPLLQALSFIIARCKAVSIYLDPNNLRFTMIITL